MLYKTVIKLLCGGGGNFILKLQLEEYGIEAMTCDYVLTTI
jgi:hypothetical protein